MSQIKYITSNWAVVLYVRHHVDGTSGDGWIELGFQVGVPIECSIAVFCVQSCFYLEFQVKWIPAMKSFGIGYYVTITFNYLLKKGEKKKKITSGHTHTKQKKGGALQYKQTFGQKTHNNPKLPQSWKN